jgi:putative flippase GtrA
MLAIKYVLFAIISTILNLLFQYFSFFFYSGFASLYVGMFVGTLAGLISKYILDKKYIFYHKPKNKKDDAKKFMMYSLVGVFTTVIFWGTEISFDALFNSDAIKNTDAVNWLNNEAIKKVTTLLGVNGESAKYIGAIVGLSIGYVTKYFLDKKYVFSK